MRDLSVFLYPIKKSHLNLNEANQFMRFEIQLKIYARKFLEQRNNKAAQYDFISWKISQFESFRFQSLGDLFDRD